MTVADPAYREAVTSTIGALPASRVESAATFWSTGSRQFASASGRETYAVLALAGRTDAARIKSFDAIRHALAAPGLTEHAGGQIPSEDAINKEVTSDIGRAEGFSLPVLLVLLLVIFGGLAAAGLPLAIGGIAILGSFTALRLLTLCTAVSIYAVNITTILGLGLAIDYGLFIVSRFREELGRTAVVEDAVARTVATAGRTVAVSGVTVAVALASLMLFPMTFLRSMGYGGVATVIVDMLAALTVLPALLAVLGPKVNALRVRPRHRAPAASGRRRGARRGAGGREQRRVVPAGPQRDAPPGRLHRGDRGRADRPRLAVPAHQLGRHRCAGAARCRRPAGGHRGAEPGLPGEHDQPDRGGRAVPGLGAGGRERRRACRLRQPPGPRPWDHRRAAGRGARRDRAGGSALFRRSHVGAGQGHRRAGAGGRAAARHAGLRRRHHGGAGRRAIQPRLRAAVDGAGGRGGHVRAAVPRLRVGGAAGQGDRDERGCRSRPRSG